MTKRPPVRLSAYPSVGIVGPGRAGIALAVALKRARVTLLGIHGRRRKTLPRGIRLTTGDRPPWLHDARVILLAVQDTELEPLVRAWRTNGPGRGQVVLHLSGARGADVLAPLRKNGAAIGGMHPLMTAMGAPRLDAINLGEATFAIEGDAAATVAARRLVKALGGHAVMLRRGARPVYHAGAVFAANYVITMLATAEDLLVRAGFRRADARLALIPLTGAAFVNAAQNGPARALTGPIMRGDADTVRRNLRALPAGVRALYRAAGEATLSLARLSGRLSAVKANGIARALRGRP